MLGNDYSSSSSHSFAKGFQAMFNIFLLHWGRHTRPAVPHSIHKTTLALSPELKECATRPQAVANCSSGNTVKTENSILELSLLLTSKKYDHIYRLKKKKKVKINAHGVEQGQDGVVESSTCDLKR